MVATAAFLHTQLGDEVTDVGHCMLSMLVFIVPTLLVKVLWKVLESVPNDAPANSALPAPAHTTHTLHMPYQQEDAQQRQHTDPVVWFAIDTVG
jgi:hypothetical protein